MWMLIAVLIAAGVCLFMSLMERPQETVDQRLKRLVTQRKTLAAFVTRDLPGNPVNPDPDDSEKQNRVSARDALVKAVEQATLGRRFTNNLATRLQRADWKWKPAEFMVAQGVAAAVGLGLAIISSPGLWWLLTALGWVVPHILLARAEKARLKLFLQQLPDVLAIIANALRSGYSFLQAMDVVSREMPDPVANEFGLVLRETRLNIPIEEALLNLVSRIKSADLDLVVTAVLIQRQVGGNLSEVLEKIGGTIKERIRLQGEIRTLTTQGRMSGWIVSVLPVGLAVVFQLIAPGYLNPLWHHPAGWLMLFAGVTMLVIGILIIKNMVNLEV